MTVIELRNHLNALMEEKEETQDAKVFLAHQPNYPLEAPATDCIVRVRVAGENRLYLGESYGGGGYLPGIVQRKFGWGRSTAADARYEEQDEEEDCDVVE